MRNGWGIQYCNINVTQSVRDISSFRPGFGPGKKGLKLKLTALWCITVNFDA